MMKYFLMVIFLCFMLMKNKMLSFYYNMCFLMGLIYIFSYKYNDNIWINMNSYFGIDYYSYFLNLLSMWILGLMFMSLMNESVLIFLFIVMLWVMLILFSLSNLLLMYLFFEISLIPTFFLIIFWGSNPERLSASFYLLMYTLFISIPLLMYLFKMFNFMQSFSFIILEISNMEMNLSILEYYMYMLAFLIKLPMYFFHIWLPKAHVEAPVYGSMILAGILLKLGSYGMLRLLKILYVDSLKFNYLLVSIGMMGSLIISFVCMVQVDMKSLVAYSSIVHMNMLMSSMMVLMKLGFIGGYIMMISHGLCSSGLFYLVNLIYIRSGSRLLMLNKGMLHIMPSIMVLWFLLCIFNFSFPMSLNFFSEILMLSVMIKWEFSLIMYLMIISFMSSAYSLYLFSYIFHGEMYVECSMNSGNLKEFLVLLLHIFPLFVSLFNLIMWMN